MSIEKDPNSEKLKMTSFPNLELIKHPDDPNPPSYTTEGLSNLDALESNLVSYLGKDNPVSGKLLLDSRHKTSIDEDKLHEQLENNLYTLNRKHSGAAIPIFMPNRFRFQLPSENISRILASTDILKKITNSRPNRRHIESLKVSLPHLIKTNPQLARNYASFMQINKLTPKINMGNLLGFHISHRMMQLFDHSPHSLLTYLKDPNKVMHNNEYHKLINDVLTQMIEQHLRGRKV